MSNNPQERNRDSRKAEEHGLTQDEEEQPEPIDKQDPTNPVKVGSDKAGAGKAKASADVGQSDAAATGAAGL